MFNEFSFVMEDRYGFSEFDTGLICGGIVFGLMIGSVVSIGFVRCMDPITVVCIGIVQIFICGVLLIVPIILYSSSYPELDGMNMWWSMVPLFLYVCADGLMLPHLVSTALEPFKECAGTLSIDTLRTFIYICFISLQYNRFSFHRKFALEFM